MKEKFFLGANSYKGFISYFEQLQKREDDLQLLILKGGPGSGKSSLMKRIASFAEQKGHDISYIPCASDPDSLDAFIDRTAHFAAVDGTAPHVMDPRLPGAQQHVIYTGDGWDCKKLSSVRGEIDRLNAEISKCHSGATSYIKSAAALLSENFAYAYEHINKRELYDVANEIICMADEKHGTEHKRLLSAVSVGKTVFFDETLRKTVGKVYIIEDKWGAAADYLLRIIREGLIAKNEEFISCRCSVIPEKLEHIIIPSVSIAISASNSFHSAQDSADAVISGVYDDFPETLLSSGRLYHAETLTAEAALCVKKAKELHDSLEAFYVDAMDFSSNDEKFSEIINKFY